MEMLIHYVFAFVSLTHYVRFSNGGWQWTASTGTDPQPYFRIFAPVSQAEKADPSGDYIRHFVPELKNLKGKGQLSILRWPFGDFIYIYLQRLTVCYAFGHVGFLS